MSSVVLSKVNSVLKYAYVYLAGIGFAFTGLFLLRMGILIARLAIPNFPGQSSLHISEHIIYLCLAGGSLFLLFGCFDCLVAGYAIIKCSIVFAFGAGVIFALLLLLDYFFDWSRVSVGSDVVVLSALAGIVSTVVYTILTRVEAEAV